MHIFSAMPYNPVVVVSNPGKVRFSIIEIDGKSKEVNWLMNPSAIKMILIF